MRSLFSPWNKILKKYILNTIVAALRKFEVLDAFTYCPLWSEENHTTWGQRIVKIFSVFIILSDLITSLLSSNDAGLCNSWEVCQSLKIKFNSSVNLPKIYIWFNSNAVIYFRILLTIFPWFESGLRFERTSSTSFFFFSSVFACGVCPSVLCSFLHTNLCSYLPVASIAAIFSFNQRQKNICCEGISWSKRYFRETF